MLAGSFLALALLPASPLCDLMQVLSHSPISPSFSPLFLFPSLSILHLSFIYYFSLYFCLLSFCCTLNFPLCITYLSLYLQHLFLTLACFHCLSLSVSLSYCRARSGNSLFVMFSLNISSPFPEELFFPFIFAQEPWYIFMLSHRPSMVQFSSGILSRSEH